jgi:hypothetical protein
MSLSPADKRSNVVAALMSAFTSFEVEDVEELLMPTIDNAVRAEYGHLAWVAWVA